MIRPLLQLQAGGTLSPQVSVYVERQEDRDFLGALAVQPAWINVHGCRTMGKSSLSAHHRQKLTDAGFRVLMVDVAANVGRDHKTVFDWIQGLANAIESDLNIDEGALMSAITNRSSGVNHLVTLFSGLLNATKSSVLLVLDEYDYIAKLGFCDELLYLLRDVQSQQARLNILQELSICFVGLEPIHRLGQPGAANSSVISESIEMVDFELTVETVRSLRQGFLPDDMPDESVFQRVLELSGGQPLITMELLKWVQRSQLKNVDAVENLIFSRVARSGLGSDLQLFGEIERWLGTYRSQAFTALQAYTSLLRGSSEAHSAPSTDLLLLCGLIRRNRKNELESKGELFRHRFDLPWAERMMQRVADRMGVPKSSAPLRGKRICVINTGGTLGMVERDGKVVPPRDEAEFKDYFTALDSIAQHIEFVSLLDTPRDSINMFPDQWKLIAEYIYKRRHQFDGFVIAHGTDTMAYTASAVAFALGPNLSFPVVFTGAQTTPDVAFGDAHVNLYRACEVAKKDIWEVVICFGNFVYRAVRSQKKDDRRFDGFESPTWPPLAEITGEINVPTDLLRKPKPNKLNDIVLRAEFEKSVLVVPQYPGLDPRHYEGFLHGKEGQPPCRGVILQTLGAGNVASLDPYSFIPFVRQAYDAGIPVIVTSQYPPDPGTHTKYSPAEAPLAAGAIHAGNLTLAAGVVKFRWVLADVLARPEWATMSPQQKKTLVSKLMVEEALIGEF